MRIISKAMLKNFWSLRSDYGDSEPHLKAWIEEVKRANWETPADVKAKFRTASILKNGRVVFNIAGNKYRLVVRIEYKIKIVYIRFIGTHKEYDKIDAEVI